MLKVGENPKPHHMKSLPLPISVQGNSSICSDWKWKLLSHSVKNRLLPLPSGLFFFPSSVLDNPSSFRISKLSLFSTIGSFYHFPLSIRWRHSKHTLWIKTVPLNSSRTKQQILLKQTMGVWFAGFFYRMSARGKTSFWERDHLTSHLIKLRTCPLCYTVLWYKARRRSNGALLPVKVMSANKSIPLEVSL